MKIEPCGLKFRPFGSISHRLGDRGSFSHQNGQNRNIFTFSEVHFCLRSMPSVQNFLLSRRVGLFYGGTSLIKRVHFNAKKTKNTFSFLLFEHVRCHSEYAWKYI